MSLLKLLSREILHTVKRPRRIADLFNKNKLSAYRKRRRLELRYGRSWVISGINDKFRKRSYRNYDDYITHQKLKLEFIDLYEYDVKYREVLRDRLQGLNLLQAGDVVLCLAARIGTEV